MASTSDYYIKFEFEFTPLMEKIMRFNQLRVKELFSKDGETEFDNYSITESDGDTIKIFLEDAIYHVLNLLVDYTYGVPDPVKVDESGKYGVTINNNQQQNDHLKLVVKNLVEQILIRFSLAGWYGIKGIETEIAFWNTQLEKSTTDIQENLFEFGLKKL